MRYTIRVLFNGRVNYVHTDNINTARYVFDVIAADLRNGTVCLWQGDTDLMQTDKTDGRVASAWDKRGEQ